MKAKVKQLLCMLLLNSILLTAVFSAPAAFADDGLSSESIEYTVASAEEPSVSARLVTNKSGTWIKAADGRYWYKHTDGTYTKNDWEYIDGSWYFFDANGWMLSAQWKQWEGKWYYLNPSGVMHTGWLNDNNKWYYFSSRGIMQTGWITISGKEYFLCDDGHMHIGWLERWNGTFYLNSDGSMQVGWKKISGSWYYFETSGKMRKSSLSENQRNYYFDGSGKLYKTEILIERVQQRYSLWCWAACSKMVGTYYTNSSITQTDIVKKIFGSELNQTGTTNDVVTAIKYASNYTKNPNSVLGYLSYSQVVDKLDANHPLVIGMLYKGGSGHMVVCSGYDKSTKKVRIIDPWKNCETRYYSYQEICIGVELQSGAGRCIEMVIF